MVLIHNYFIRLVIQNFFHSSASLERSWNAFIDDLKEVPISGFNYGIIYLDKQVIGKEVEDSLNLKI